MKNILKIALIALIIILVGTLNIYATNASITSTVDKNEVKIGDIIKISLSANCDEGIEGIDSTLVYDGTKLELQNLNVSSKFSNMSGKDNATGEYKITVISNSTETLTSETFATLDFKVLDSVKLDEELNVKFSAIELGDSNDEWTKISNTEVVVKVIEETPKKGDSNKPGTENNNDNNQSTNKENNKDNTQANKPINKAGLKDYAFIIIPVISVIAYISYKKYKQYKNI